MSKEIIKIFLASSEELVEDRKEFETFIYRKTKLLIKKDIFLELIIWEDFLDSISPVRKQDDYNKAIEKCDIFVLLFFTKVGKYTEEEFDIAYQHFNETGKPIIFTFFKNAPIESGKIDEKVLSMINFKKRLSKLEHFYSEYQTIDGLKLQFSQQLEKLELENFLLNEENDKLRILAKKTAADSNITGYHDRFANITENDRFMEMLEHNPTPGASSGQVDAKPAASIDDWVKILKQCQSLQNQQVFEEVLSELPPVIRNNLNVQLPTINAKLRNLVKICRDNHQNGLKHLVKAISDLEGNTPCVSELNKLLKD